MVDAAEKAGPSGLIRDKDGQWPAGWFLTLEEVARG